MTRTMLCAHADLRCSTRYDQGVVRKDRPDGNMYRMRVQVCRKIKTASEPEVRHVFGGVPWLCVRTPVLDS